MKPFLIKWPDGTATLVCASSIDDAIWLADEFASADPEDVVLLDRPFIAQTTVSEIVRRKRWAHVG